MNEIIRTDLLKKEYYTITVGIPRAGASLHGGSTTRRTIR